VPSGYDGRVKDWDFVAEWASRQPPGAALITYRQEAEEVPRRRLLEQNGPLSYQDYLYAMVRCQRPAVVVETGVRFGVSSYLILLALQRNERGHLYSCDPMHANQHVAQEAMARVLRVFPDFDRWTFSGVSSRKVLPELGTRTGPWNLFVHDSDHGERNMAWELRTAWPRLAPGGVLVCDDWDWPNPHGPHRAWERFCDRHDLEFFTIGTAAVAVKPTN
jgi:predicted O-methyltransferase YrrM